MIQRRIALVLAVLLLLTSCSLLEEKGLLPFGGSSQSGSSGKLLNPFGNVKKDPKQLDDPAPAEEKAYATDYARLVLPEQDRDHYYAKSVVESSATPWESILRVYWSQSQKLGDYSPFQPDGGIDPEYDSDLYVILYTDYSKTATEYREQFLGYGVELEALAQEQVNHLMVDGAKFFALEDGLAYSYRHDASGIEYTLLLGDREPGEPVEPHSDLWEIIHPLLEGITLTPPEGTLNKTPWPWEGRRVLPVCAPVTVGGVQLTPAVLETEAPILFRMYGSGMARAVAGEGNDRILYIHHEGDLAEYRWPTGNNTLQLSEIHAIGFSYDIVGMDADRKGTLYLSLWDGSCLTFQKGMQSSIELPGKLSVHSSGEWGITHSYYSGLLEVNLGTMEERPWKEDEDPDLADLVTIGERYVTLLRRDIDGGRDRLVVNAFDGTERFLLEEPPAAPDKDPGYVRVVETPNGFLALANAMDYQTWKSDATTIILWDEQGRWMGTTDAAELLGLPDSSAVDAQWLEDGTILLALTQMREDDSAKELLLFTLSGF